MKYIFGPVQSRRLGRSLGIDLFFGKLCTLNCVYCEVGVAAAPICQRGMYSPVAEICAEIDNYCADAQQMERVDVVTVTAKGEPTLHSGLGRILAHLKQRCGKPVVVLTNGTTLNDPEVFDSLMAADIVIPSLDSARRESFAAVDRPSADLDLAEVVDGLTRFTHAFQGRIWLEILLVRTLNDSPADIEALAAALKPMRIDRIQLNTVIRPPLEAWAEPVEPERLAAIARQLHQELALPVDLPFAPAKQDDSGQAAAETARSVPASPTTAVLDAIREMLKRRPCTAADIDRTFQLGGPEQVEQLLEPLVRSGALHLRAHGSNRFYQQPS